MISVPASGGGGHGVHVLITGVYYSPSQTSRKRQIIYCVVCSGESRLVAGLGLGGD